MKNPKKVIMPIVICCMLGATSTGCARQTTTADTATATEQQDLETEQQDIETNETEQQDLETNETTKETETTVDIVPGTNMSDAAELPLNTQTAGTVEAGQTVWYSFTTGDTESYRVIMVNTSSDKTPVIEGRVYDEYGDGVGGQSHFVYNTGTPETIDIEKADAESIYYISLQGDTREDIDYTVVVKPIEK